jgi:hypothetical protein
LHSHGEEESCGHDHTHGKKRSKGKPNAYEIDPQEKKRKKALKKAKLAAAQQAEVKKQQTDAGKAENSTPKESSSRNEYPAH